MSGSGPIPHVPRATLVAILILVASASAAFAFVLQRGSLAMPELLPGATGSTGSASPPMAPGQTPPVALTPFPSTSGAIGLGSEGGPSPLPTVAGPGTPAATAPGSTPPAGPSHTAAPTTVPEPGSRSSPGPGAGAAATEAPSGAVAGTRSGSTASPSACGADGCTVYVVRPGDNLTAIARWFGVSLERVFAVNPGLGSGDLIQPGQTLRIPAACAERSKCSVYEVRTGDTLTAVAARFHVTLDQIWQANPWLGRGDRVRPGQRVVIPAAIP